MNQDFYINNPTNKIQDSYLSRILEQNKASEYHASLPFYKPTPLIKLPNLANKYGVGEICCKDESYRFGLNAFKGLGASYAISHLLQKSKQIKTFCTATDGNHGRAVAWASKLAGKNSVVYVPVGTSKSRMDSIASEGATVILTEVNYDETCKIAAERSRKENWQLVQDNSWPGYEEIPALIMSGYLTMFHEMEEQLQQSSQSIPDVVFLQAGVGSWAGSAIWYFLTRFKENRPKIVIVEPTEADGILESLKAGKIVMPKGTFHTIMAGLNCGLPSLIAWDLLKNGTDVAIRITDNKAEQAIREYYFSQGDDQRIIAGESGAAGLGGFLSIMSDLKMRPLKSFLQLNEKSRILFINTEGATDPENFSRIIKS